MELKIPALSEIIKYNPDFDNVEINWEKFILLEDLSRKKEVEIKTKATRYLGYYICYLTTNNFLERLEERSYIIVKKNNLYIKKDSILNPKMRDIIYGFSRKEDAHQYSNIAYPEKNGDLVIDRYTEIFEDPNYS